MREVRLKVKVPVEEGGRIRRPGRLRPDPTIFTSTQSATGMGPRSRHDHIMLILCLSPGWDYGFLVGREVSLPSLMPQCPGLCLAWE